MTSSSRSSSICWPSMVNELSAAVPTKQPPLAGVRTNQLQGVRMHEVATAASTDRDSASGGAALEQRESPTIAGAAAA